MPNLDLIFEGEQLVIRSEKEIANTPAPAVEVAPVQQVVEQPVAQPVQQEVQQPVAQEVAQPAHLPQAVMQKSGSHNVNLVVLTMQQTVSISVVTNYLPLI